MLRGSAPAADAILVAARDIFDSCRDSSLQAPSSMMRRLKEGVLVGGMELWQLVFARREGVYEGILAAKTRYA